MTYLGLRPGEKLYEELLVKTEELDKTPNSMIFIERDTPLCEHDIDVKLEELKAAFANVFVGRQQYDRYVDHKIILKSTYIYNMYPMEKKQKRKFENQHTVTYIGSLVPEKGFQVLAAAWKKIIAEVPDG